MVFMVIERVANMDVPPLQKTIESEAMKNTEVFLRKVENITESMNKVCVDTIQSTRFLLHLCKPHAIIYAIYFFFYI